MLFHLKPDILMERDALVHSCNDIIWRGDNFITPSCFVKSQNALEIVIDTRGQCTLILPSYQTLRCQLDAFCHTVRCLWKYLISVYAMEVMGIVRDGEISNESQCT